jgi:hypothetical protein
LALVLGGCAPVARGQLAVFAEGGSSLIAVSLHDTIVSVLDAKTLAEVWRAPTRLSWIKRIALSTSGRYVWARGDEEIVAWDRSTQREIYRCKVGDPSMTPRFSKDERWLAVPQSGRQVSLHELPSGREVARFDDNWGPLGFGGDGKWLALRGVTGLTVVELGATGPHTVVPVPADEPVIGRGAAFVVRDAKSVWRVAAAGGTAVTTGRDVRPLNAQQAPALSAVFSDDREILVLDEAGQILLRAAAEPARVADAIGTTQGALIAYMNGKIVAYRRGATVTIADVGERMRSGHNYYTDGASVLYRPARLSQDGRAALYYRSTDEFHVVWLP